MDEIKQLMQITELAGPGYSELKWVDGKKANCPKDAKITEDVIRAHFGGTQPVGINMNVGDDKSHFAVFDLDDHDGTLNAGVMLKRVGFIAAALQNLGVPYFVVRSGSGKGLSPVGCLRERRAHGQYPRANGGGSRRGQQAPFAVALGAREVAQEVPAFSQVGISSKALALEYLRRWNVLSFCSDKLGMDAPPHLATVCVYRRRTDERLPTVEGESEIQYRS